MEFYKKILLISLLLFSSCIEKSIDGHIYKKYITPGYICIDCIWSGGGCTSYFYNQYQDEYVFKIADDLTNEIRKFYVPKSYYENLSVNDVVKCEKCVNDASSYKTERKFYREYVEYVEYEKLAKKYERCLYIDKD